MGFNSVYRVLQNVFPQVDTRLLRAAAIENSKDVDTAVEAVLEGIIPYLSKAVEDASLGEDTLQVHSTDTKTLNGSTNCKAGSDHDEVCRDDGNMESASSGKHEKSNVIDGSDVISLVTPIATLYSNGADDHGNHVDTKTQESSTVKIGSDQGSHVSSTSSIHGYGCTNGTTSGNQLADLEYFDGMCPCGCNILVPGESHQEQAHFDCSHLEVENAVVQLAPLLFQEYKPDAPERGLQVAFVDSLLGNSEKPESSGASDDAWKNDERSREMVDFEDESALDTVQDIIEDPRNNKKTLFSAMVSLMREVELQEKAAELAKGKAARGDFDILVRVEDFRQMLQHAKEANNMHAGEVFGEEAILATEVRELQSRLLSLSDGRDKSLAILDKIEILNVQVWHVVQLDSHALPMSLRPGHAYFILKPPGSDTITAFDPYSGPNSRRIQCLQNERFSGLKLIGYSFHGLLLLARGSLVLYYNLESSQFTRLPPVQWEVRNHLGWFTDQPPMPNNRTFLVELRGGVAELLEYSTQNGEWRRSPYNIASDMAKAIGVGVVPGGSQMVVLDNRNSIHVFSTDFDNRRYRHFQIPAHFQVDLGHSPASLISSEDHLYILHGDDPRVIQIVPAAAPNIFVQSDFDNRVVWAVNHSNGIIRNPVRHWESHRVFFAGLDWRREIARANTRFSPSVYHGLIQCHLHALCKCNYAVYEA